MTGTINRIRADKRFGFIRPEDSTDARGDHFFHASELYGGLAFDERLVGQRVEFESTKNDKGLTALAVRTVA